MSSSSGINADLAEIRALVDRYAIAMDQVDLDAFPQLFVSDGALVVLAPGREKPMGTFTGPGADGVGMIAVLMSELYRDTLHHITTHHVTVDGDEAHGWTYTLAYHVVAGEDGGVLETLGVKYEEHCVRTPVGWRFQTRRATRLWSQVTPTPHEPLMIDRAAARARAKAPGG
jgi:SnoaL-like domain